MCSDHPFIAEAVEDRGEKGGVPVHCGQECRRCFGAKRVIK